jgi:Sulfatase
VAGEQTGSELLGLLRTRGLMILGLSGLAVTQPLLDLFGNNPEFFVAGNYSRGQIVAFALLITLVPPLIGVGLTAAATLVDRRAGTIVFAAVSAVLAGAFVLALLRTLEVDATVLVFAAAVAGGVLVAVAIVRTRGAQLFVSYLAAANLLFVGSFLFFSPTSELVAGGSTGDLGSVDVPVPEGPVVVLVLDEFPAATIMRADGSLNADRYPGFAELASVSTWFRNASSRHNLTHRAVPQLLSGTIGADDDLPTYEDHPRNLFTLLGDDVPVRRYESVTDMCPPSVCEPPPRQPLSQAIEDASVVYGHRVLPSAFRDGLPAIDNSWGAYGAQDDRGGGDPDDAAGSATEGATHIERAYARWIGLDADERSPRGQARVLRDEIAAIKGNPSLHVVHVALPHRPWVLSRTGVATSYEPELITDPTAPGYAFGARLDAQLHAMQVGAVDTMMAELVDHLRDLPTWEQTLLVVTSDHGSNLSPPDIGRMKVTDANREEVYRAPLFVKAPGQVEGEVRDESAQMIDVLPSIVDLLDADVDWDFDGHSLYDGSAARTAPLISTEVDAAVAIAERRAADFPHGDDWTALAAVGDNGELVGRRVDDLAVGAPSTYRATLEQADLFGDLPTADGTMPFVLAGTVSATNGSGAEPPELLAGVNGTLAGVVGGYRPAAGGWDFTGYVADLYREGANEIALYEVARDGEAVTLHPVLRAA